MECFAELSRAGSLPAGPQIASLPSGLNFFSPFSSLDFRLTKGIRITERMRLSLIGEAFNIFNATNVRGFYKNSYSGRNIALVAASPNLITPTNPQGINLTFFKATGIAGGFFGSGGARAFQFARLDF